MSESIKVYDFVEVSPQTIPLPHQAPEATTTGFTKSVGIMGTVETLIGQNEDLMARLKVNLRRNAQLETDVQELRTKLQETLEHQLAIQSSGDIWQEKEKYWVADRDDLKLEIQNLQKVRQSLLQENNLLRRYRGRINKWVRETFKQKLYNAKKFELLWHNLKIETRKKDERIVDLQDRNAQIVQELARLESQFRIDSNSLVDRYEKKLSALSLENKELAKENQNLRQKAILVDSSTGQVSELNNRIIELQNKFEQTQAELFRAQSENARLEATRQNLQADFDNKIVTLAMTEAELSTVREQATALNNLWTDFQSEAAELKAQNRALTQLNQNLALKLKSKDESPRPASAASTEKLDELDALLNQIESTVHRRPSSRSDFK